MKRMGGMEGMMGLLPGVQKVKKQIAESGIDDKHLPTASMAIIGSMTKPERKKPDILAASRKRRIAAGAGVDVAEVNRLLEAAPPDGRHLQGDDQGRRQGHGPHGPDDGRRRHGPSARSMGGGKIAQPDPNAAGGQRPARAARYAGSRRRRRRQAQSSPACGLPGFNPFKK